MSVSANIKKLRESRGMTQRQLADRIGVTRAAISQFENGLSSPKISTVKRLAEVFGVDPAEIVAEEIEQVWDSNIQHWLSTLNPDGKEQAMEYLEMLSNNPKYRK